MAVQQSGAAWHVLASDGSVVRIRPLREDDEAALDAMNQRVSDWSMYLRFFGISRSSADAYMHHLRIMHDGDVALVVEYGDQPVGVASYEPLRTGEAAVAFLLEDSVQGQGIATLLVEQFAAAARENGVQRLRAETLADNAGMYACSPTPASNRSADSTAESSSWSWRQPAGRRRGSGSQTARVPPKAARCIDPSRPARWGDPEPDWYARRMRADSQ
jgi:RimJ/RimL family protein N-acetyltransferase